jgi:hypothetical protein
MTIPDDWAPEACTLPSAERPLRVAEFDDMFRWVQQSTRREPTRLELVLPHGVEAEARDLARRESECCSFFTFEFRVAGRDLVMSIGVPPEQVGVLDAIAARAAGK